MVAFAMSVVLATEFDAVKFTAYVPVGVPEGAPLPSETFAVWPGFSAIDEDERLVDHPAGSVDERLTVLAAHPEESLFVTETEYPAVWPG